MPRSNRPRRPNRPARPGKWSSAGRQPSEEEEEGAFRGPGLAIPSLQSAPDGQWHVRRISAARAGKTYICPGCHRNIDPGTEHIVAWRADHWSGDEASAAGRRHWHLKCWSGRSFRY